jgi:hypothetical protein
VQALEQRDSRRVRTGVRLRHDGSVVFMFPGQALSTTRWD